MATKINTNKRILITGSRGFIGQHLTKELNDLGYINVFDYDLKDRYSSDILNKKLLKETIDACKPDVVIHLAAISSLPDVEKDPQKAMITNVVGTYNVLEAACRYGIRTILASSAAVEEKSSSLYGVTKETMESLAYLPQFRPWAIVMRFFNVYGPGSKSVVNKLIDAVKNGDDIRLNGNTTRDYIYVDDVVQAIIRIMEAPKPEKLLKVGTGRSVSLRKLLSMIATFVGKEPNFVQLGPPIHEIQDSVARDMSIGFYKTTLEQGIKKLI